MKINVLYFAVFRERLKRDSETVDLADGAGLDALVAALEERHPEVRGLRGRYRIAVNQEMVAESPVLRDGDEIALIPPVAGGDDRRAVVLDEPLSLDRVVAAVRSPEAGGV